MIRLWGSGVDLSKLRGCASCVSKEIFTGVRQSGGILMKNIIFLWSGRDEWWMDGGTWWGNLIHPWKCHVLCSFHSDFPPIDFWSPPVALQDLPIALQDLHVALQVLLVAITGPSCSNPKRGWNLNFEGMGWWGVVFTWVWMVDMKWMEGGVERILRMLALYLWNQPLSSNLQNDKKNSRHVVDPCPGIFPLFYLFSLFFLLSFFVFVFVFETHRLP